MPPAPRSAPHPSTHLGPDRPVLVRGEGCHVWDRDGRRYLDGTSGAFCATFGYTRPDFVEAMARAAEKLPHARPSLFDNEEAEAYRAELLEAVGPPFKRVMLTSSGSEAVDVAIKVAIAFQRAMGFADRVGVRSLPEHFHGATLGAMAVTAWASRRGFWDAALPPLTLGLPEPGDTSAALIAETIPVAAAGVTLPHPGGMAEIRARCDAAGALWIADEVLTGFGRVGSMFAWKRWGEENAADAAAVPDLVVFGKGAGAGFAPLAGVLVTKRVADTVLAEATERGIVLHQQTYGRNPISCAVGSAVLRALHSDEGFARARRMEAKLREILLGIGGRKAGLDVYGALAGFETVARFASRAAERGVLVHDAGARAVLAPPLAMTDAAWEEMAAGLEAAARAGSAD